MTDTQSLLAEYVRTGSDTAFRELVVRYVNLVYSTALRLVGGDMHRAEDVAQTVFVDLARQARTLSPDAMLGGWLHRHTCFVAANTLRGERRRQSREREAMEMNALHNDSGTDFSLIAPILDESINQLNEEDRTAILLRFFEQRDFRSVGEALGSNEDAARMRVTRALEKLHLLLKRRGISTGAAALGLALSASGVQSAPAGLAGAISTTALVTGNAAFTSTAITTTKTIAMTALQKTIVGAALIAAAGTGVYEAHQAARLHEQNQTLQLQQTALAEQIRQLQRERNHATNQLAGLLAANAQLQSSANESELLKLRGEVTQLQYQTNDPTAVAAKSWLDRVNQLKQWADQNPAATIPEFKQFLYNQDWLAAARSPLTTDADYRRAMSNLRNRAEENFAGELEIAVSRYKKANHGQFPTDLNQLQSYFDSPVDEAVLQRWEIVPAKTVSNIGVGGPNIITERAAVDDLLDTRFVVGSQGSGSTDFLGTEIGNTLAPVYKAFSAANNGQSPAGPSQLAPYASTPEQKAAVQKLIEQQQLKSAP